MTGTDPGEDVARRKTSRWLRVLLIGIVVALVAWYVSTHWESFRVLRELDVRYLPAMVAAILLTQAAQGLINRDLLRPFGVKLRFSEWYGLAIVNSFANYLPIPQAGAISKGVYLKRRYEFPYPLYIATYVVTNLIALGAGGLIGLAGLAALLVERRESPWQLWIIFALLAGTFLVLTPVSSLGPFGKRFLTYREGLERLREAKILHRVALLHVLRLVLNATVLWLAFLSIDKSPGWLAAMMVTLLAMVTQVARVTPANIGVAEAATFMTAFLLGEDPEMAVVAYTVFRAATMVVFFVLGPIFVAHLTKLRGRGQDDGSDGDRLHAR